MTTSPKPELKIDKGVPIPPPKTHTGMTAAIRKMEVGDSIAFHCGPESVSAAFRRTLGAGSYTARTEGTGCRVWRIK